VCADQPIAKPIIALGQWKRVLADDITTADIKLDGRAMQSFEK
jgi:hypothetical protein